MERLRALIYGAPKRPVYTGPVYRPGSPLARAFDGRTVAQKLGGK